MISFLFPSSICYFLKCYFITSLSNKVLPIFHFASDSLCHYVTCLRRRINSFSIFSQVLFRSFYRRFFSIHFIISVATNCHFSILIYIFSKKSRFYQFIIRRFRLHSENYTYREINLHPLFYDCFVPKFCRKIRGVFPSLVNCDKNFCFFFSKSVIVFFWGNYF